MSALFRSMVVVWYQKQVQISNEKEMAKDILGCQSLEPFSECYYCPNNAYLIGLKNYISMFHYISPYYLPVINMGNWSL